MNSFGTIFRVSIFGESHGNSVGIVIDGVPPGVPIADVDFEADSARRKSGARGTTPRIEEDTPRLMSGVFNGHSTGAPLMILFENSNTRSRDYSFLKETPRPGHADFVASQKYAGFEDYRGGGHFSGRLTLGIVAAGVIAKKIIAPINVSAELVEAGGSSDIEKAVDEAIAREDSIGGIIRCVATGMPVGLGEPFFDSVESMISHMIFAIPALASLPPGCTAASIMTGSSTDPAKQPPTTPLA